MNTMHWEEKPTSTTDANGNTTTYQYDAKGLLIKIIDPMGGTTAFQYDLAGRKTDEVSPKNYDSTKAITQMNRVKYTYDLMDRITLR